MAHLLDRLPVVAEEHREVLPQLRAQVNSVDQDAQGTASNMLGLKLRLLAVAAYVLDSDVQVFRSYLRESAGIKESLFERHMVGEPISDSYVSMMAYKSLYDALACGDMKFARSFAAKVGGRDALERQYDHRFTRAIGYALKYVILLSNEKAAPAVEELFAVCERKGYKSYLGYALCMHAILEQSSSRFMEGVREALKAHKRLCSRGRMFDLTADEIICTWSLGLVNLARANGMDVTVEHPLVPRVLVAA